MQLSRFLRFLPVNGRSIIVLGVSLIATAAIAAACGEEEKTPGPTQAPSTPTATSTGVTTTPTATGTPAASAAIEAEDQESDGITVVIASVTLPDGGFVVIHSDQAGAPGPVVGHSDALPAGTSTDVEVTLGQPLTESATVWPMAHIDDGNGTYEFPGPDVPATDAEGKVVVLPIEVTVAATETPTETATETATETPAVGAAIEADDRESDGTTVVIASVTLPEGGFVVIHSDQAGAPGPVIGHSDALPAGTSTDVEVTLDQPLTGPATVWPMAHVDDGNGSYEFPGADVPATDAEGKVVVLPINVTVGGTPTGGVSLTVTTPSGVQFDKAELTAPAGAEVTVEYHNDSSITHNIHFFAGPDASAETLGATEIAAGPGNVQTITFTAPSEPGSYHFQCDVHPGDMQGTLIVE